jgi:hypothetical protein
MFYIDKTGIKGRGSVKRALFECYFYAIFCNVASYLCRISEETIKI